MEEKKNVEAPVKQEQKKLTYEELLNAANNWAQQAKFYKQKTEELSSELQKVSIYNDFKAMDYMFKVLEMSHQFDDGFVSACAARIQEFLKPCIQDDEDKEDKS